MSKNSRNPKQQPEPRPSYKGLKKLWTSPKKEIITIKRILEAEEVAKKKREETTRET